MMQIRGSGEGMLVTARARDGLDDWTLATSPANLAGHSTKATATLLLPGQSMIAGWQSPDFGVFALRTDFQRSAIEVHVT